MEDRMSTFEGAMNQIEDLEQCAVHSFVLVQFNKSFKMLL